MKKVLSFLLAIMMLLSLCACGGKEAEGPSVSSVSDYLLSINETPVTGSVGGEWLVFGLARAEVEVPDGYFDSYYAGLEEYVTSCGGVLSDRKYSEFSRVIIAVTAIGKDARNVAGYDLTLPLAHYERTIFQGINGAVYALLSLDCGGYEIPVTAEGTQATRDMYVDYILSLECPGGGWTFAGGAAEVDMTAMVLQALAKYTHREDVKAAVDRGLAFISGAQLTHGGFAENDMESCETLAQVIVAFAELGIPLDDARFVKDGHTVLDRMFEFYMADGGFCHNIGEEESNPMATEQALYAMTALWRNENGKTTLYSVAE
ncbi:MAG: hypothetical protein IJ017_00970 [Oscillospiraceae bacterium]|nr:hypothetical protein [Oscillospiraceae bacterium]